MGGTAADKQTDVVSQPLITAVHYAKALYTYEGGDDEQLPFAEGDEIAIVDSSDPDWWKTEKAGVIFIVPASYLELTG